MMNSNLMSVIKNTNVKRMMKTIISLVKIYCCVDVGLVLLSLYVGGDWLLNTQAAFVCSLLITLASFRSYSTLVKSNLDTGNIPEDPFEKHYQKDDAEENDEGVNETKVVEQSPKIGFFGSFKNLASSSKSALSFYRIGAYALLFIVILFLIRHDQFDAIAFFVGSSIIPLASLMSAVFVKKGLYETNE